MPEQPAPTAPTQPHRTTPPGADDITILGGGIAGLSIGYQLSNLNKTSFRIYEAQQQSGGLARSFCWHGIDCDIAPHRLFSENQDVLKSLLTLVECNKIPRNSKIVLDGKWITDPISIIELLKVNFPFRTFRLMKSYLYARLTTTPAFNNFDDFAKASYGHELNELFFKPYAEKLLGLKSDQIAAAWGTRKLRVSGFRDVIRKNTKLYFNYFYYPKSGGYGAFSRALSESISKQIELQQRLEKIIYHASDRIYECHFRNQHGEIVIRHSPILVSTLPLPALLGLLGHKLELRYRKLRLIYLYVDRDRVMDEQWVYFIDQSTMINRVSEFKNFYPQHPQQGKTVLCAEITSTPDCTTVSVIDELAGLGILNEQDILDSKVVDIDNAYPIFDSNYEQSVAKAHTILQQHPNLFLLGRQAQFLHQDIDEIFESAQHTATRCLQALEQG